MKTPMDDKSPEMRAVIESLFPGTAKAIKDKLCPMCKQPITTFRHQTDVREYEISGMCQDCQDKTFGR